MEFMELARSRYSCRKFTGEKVDKQKLIDCVEAAILTPSACNSQPWHFTIVTKPELVARLAKATQINPPTNVFSDNSAAMVVLSEDKQPAVYQRVVDRYSADVFAEGDVGRAAGYFCLRAYELGLGTCMLGMFDEEEVLDVVKLPDSQRLRLLIAVGVPADSEATHTKKRRPVEEVLRFIE